MKFQDVLINGGAVASVVVGLALVGTGSHPVHGQQPPPYNLKAPVRPDPRLTPGDTLDVTARDFCVSGYSKKVRNVPQSVKEQVYRNYGITHRERGEYEVDHLISLQLGGSNSIKNLWPESYKTQPWNASIKDQLENAFHRDICQGHLNTRVAQQKMARDWIAAYKERFHTKVPLRKPAVKDDDDDGIDPGAGQRPRTTLASPRGSGTTRSSRTPRRATSTKVWVNLDSGKYWLPGSRHYGKTLKGKYLPEASAKRAGYTRAEGQ